MSNSVFVKFCLMSSVASNRRPFRTFLSLGNRKKSHGVRLVSMVTAATERCRVWPKTAAQGVKCVYGNIVVVQDPVTIPPFFWSFSANWFTQTSQDRQAEFLVNYLPIGSILVVYDTLRINHFLVSRCRPEWGSLSAEVLPSLNRRNQSNTCVWPIASSPYACCSNCYVSITVFPILKQKLMQMRCSVLSHIVKITVT